MSKILSAITETELKIIKENIRQFSNVNDFKIYIRDKILSISEGIIDVEKSKKLFPTVFSQDPNLAHKIQKYKSSLRFVLVNEKRREFSVQVSDFSGNWYTLENSKSLNQLSRKYCYHLGRKSFHELLALAKDIQND